MKKNRYSVSFFRHETQPKQNEKHVFKFRIKQDYSTVCIMPKILSLCSPKGISTNSAPLLRICKNFEKLGFRFDMSLNRNNVKYMFLY